MHAFVRSRGTPSPDAGRKPLAESATDLLQVLGILFLAGLFCVILYKACDDLSTLARTHPGEAFWSALGRYLMANLAS